MLRVVKLIARMDRKVVLENIENVKIAKERNKKPKINMHMMIVTLLAIVFVPCVLNVIVCYDLETMIV